MRQRIIYIVLRIVLAFAFIYSAFLGFLHPYDWIVYFPNILRNHLPDNLLLNLFGLSEIVIGAWLVWGKAIFIPSLAASFYLFFIIVFNLDQFSELFRDIPILGIAFSLAILSYPRTISKSRF